MAKTKPTISEESVEALVYDQKNANRGNVRGRALLETSMRQNGFLEPGVLDRANRIIGGNKRTEVAYELGMDQAIIVETDGTRPIYVRRTDLDLDTPEGRAAALALNQTAKVGIEFDGDILAEFAAMGVPVGTYFTDDELAALLPADPHHRLKPGADSDELPDSTETRVQPGDLWALGEHRLLCGDATDETAVQRLFGDDRLSTIWTDPPYGIGYVGKTKEALTIANDRLSEKATEELVRTALQHASTVAKPGASVYVACPPGTPLPFFITGVATSGFTFKHSLVWVKDQFVMGRCDYHYRHEVILFGWLETGPHYFVKDHTLDSVFEIPRPKRSTDHPTMKPVELIRRQVANSSRIDEIVYDPFGGSGTTIIACQMLKRRARTMELDPQYADVILTRFEQLTGIQPELLERIPPPAEGGQP